MPVLQPSQVTLGGTWRGIEERESERDADQCEIALNCFFQDGVIKARRGFQRQSIGALTVRGHMHAIKREGRL